jgi:hypothetical protein
VDSQKDAIGGGKRKRNILAVEIEMVLTEGRSDY